MALTTVNRVKIDPIERKTPGVAIRLYVNDTITVEKTEILLILEAYGFGPGIIKKEFPGGVHKVQLKNGNSFYTDDAGKGLLV